jgi:hypothetical protein
MMEKDKLHAKKQALQKKEKDGRLAELKAFHQSFKLNVPIPADLVPLLSKGKKSTENINQKSESPESKSTSSPPVAQDKKKSVPAAASTTTAVSTKKPTVTATAPTATSPATATTASPNSATTTSTNTTAISPTPANANSFKFNVKASSFKPNPSAAAFVPGGNTVSDYNEPHHNNFYGGRPLKKQTGGPGEHLTMTEAFSPSFVDKDIAPNSVGPTWPFGHKSYRVQFSQFVTYEEDVFTGYPSPNYGYGYPQYRYPQVNKLLIFIYSD